jgi:hypothetical protein
MAMTSDRDNEPVEQPANPAADEVGKSRREAILRLAKYTAPAMLAMLLSEQAAAGS